MQAAASAAQGPAAAHPGPSSASVPKAPAGPSAAEIRQNTQQAQQTAVPEAPDLTMSANESGTKRAASASEEPSKFQATESGEAVSTNHSPRSEATTAPSLSEEESNTLGNQISGVFTRVEIKDLDFSIEQIEQDPELKLLLVQALYRTPDLTLDGWVQQKTARPLKNPLTKYKRIIKKVKLEDTEHQQRQPSTASEGVAELPVNESGLPMEEEGPEGEVNDSGDGKVWVSPADGA